MLPLQDQSGFPPIESTSGGTYTWPVLAEKGATEQIRIPIVQDDVFICTGGVDVVKLLRISRASAYNTALVRADSYVERNKKVVLVDEHWQCTIVTTPHGHDLYYKSYVRYCALATVSKYADHEWPVAVDQVRGVPGLMTILERK